MAEALKEEDYTAESWKNFADILAEAKAILAKEDATQEEVNSIKASLEKAIEELKEVDNEKPVEVDKTQLKKLIIGAEALKKDDYTKESWENFVNVLKYAKVILVKEDATQEAVNDIRDKLTKAINDLKLSENSGSNGENNSGGINNNSNSGNNGLPSTGGTSPAAVGLFGTIVSLLGAFMVKKKNSKN